MRSDVIPGAKFPDYELPDHTGKHRKLSELQAGDPMVVVLSRGGYCPKDRRQHEGLVQLHREMEVGYCRMVTISTDNLLATNEFPRELRADLRAVLQKCRPDWDITRPERRAAWERGDKNGFYPYGKSLAKVFGEQE